MSFIYLYNNRRDASDMDGVVEVIEQDQRPGYIVRMEPDPNYLPRPQANPSRPRAHNNVNIIQYVYDREYIYDSGNHVIYIRRPELIDDGLASPGQFDCDVHVASDTLTRRTVGVVASPTDAAIRGTVGVGAGPTPQDIRYGTTQSSFYCDDPVNVGDVVVYDNDNPALVRAIRAGLGARAGTVLHVESNTSVNGRPGRRVVTVLDD
jgi:hypothetical protein